MCKILLYCLYLPQSACFLVFVVLCGTTSDETNQRRKISCSLAGKDVYCLFIPELPAWCTGRSGWPLPGEQARGAMPTARYLGIRAVKPPSEHPSVGEGEKTKLPLSKRGCEGEARAEAWWGCSVCVCLVALVELPEPAAASLLPCTPWGMWGAVGGDCLGLGWPLFPRSVPAPGVASCQRDTPLPPIQTSLEHGKILSHVCQRPGQRCLCWSLTLHWSLSETGVLAVAPSYTHVSVSDPTQVLCFSQWEVLYSNFNIGNAEAGLQPSSGGQRWPCGGHSRTAIASTGGDAVRPAEAGAILGRVWQPVVLEFTERVQMDPMDPRSGFSDWVRWACSWRQPTNALLCSSFQGRDCKPQSQGDHGGICNDRLSPILCSLTKPCLRREADGRRSHPHPAPLLRTYCHLHATVCHLSHTLSLFRGLHCKVDQ